MNLSTTVFFSEKQKIVFMWISFCACLLLFFWWRGWMGRKKRTILIKLNLLNSSVLEHLMLGEMQLFFQEISFHPMFFKWLETNWRLFELKPSTMTEICDKLLFASCVFIGYKFRAYEDYFERIRGILVSRISWYLWQVLK